MIFSKKYSPINIQNNFFYLGEKSFLIGILLLPSALPIGGFFLLSSIVISFYKNNKNLIKNKWNIIFLISSLLIVLSTLYNCFFDLSPVLQNIDKSIILFNLFNWVPIYIAFLAFQIYLKSEKQRVLFQKFLIAGTIPVLISCIMQKFLNIYGPFETLFGTIVWFNYNHGFDAVSGLFNNPNYLGTWLTICLPFSITLLRIEKVKSHKFFLFILNLLIIYFAIFTNSRNAFFGIFISLIIVFGIRKFIYFTLLIFFGIFIFNFFLPYLLDLDNSHLFYKLTNINPNLNYPRIYIWKNAINLISQRPLLGWGPGTFPYVTSYLPPFQNYQHTHNFIIEIAFNFGIPISLIVFTNLTTLINAAFIKVKNLNNTLNEYKIYISFIASFTVFLVSQLNDITYYDGKISIIFSVLLACLKNIIDEEKSNISKFIDNE
tara:strand:- start:43 stop:1338 length:1296 start_codon:yes stop_codon:yes gene_type:complete